MTAKLESHQRLIAHLKEQNSQLHLRVSNLEQRNSFLETQNKEMGARVQGLLAQSRDYDLPHLQVIRVIGTMVGRLAGRLWRETYC